MATERTQVDYQKQYPSYRQFIEDFADRADITHVESENFCLTSLSLILQRISRDEAENVLSALPRELHAIFDETTPQDKGITAQDFFRNTKEVFPTRANQTVLLQRRFGLYLRKYFTEEMMGELRYQLPKDIDHLLFGTLNRQLSVA